MDFLKKGLEAYQESQSDVSKTGGEEYNRPSHSQHGQQSSGTPDVDEDYAVQHAARHAGDSGDTSLFSSAMGFLKDNSGAKHEPVNEEHVQNAHKEAYERGQGGNLSPDGMGSAAAMQAFKMFTSGGGGGGGGGNSQSTLISMAMSEATKLFDSSGGSNGGNKQDVVNSAAMTVMKLLVQSKFSSMTGGGNSGGIGGLLSMASKFA